MPDAPPEAVVAPVHTERVDLSGRAVGLRWYGAGPDGAVVVYAHGGLSCAADAALGHAAAADVGIGLLAVDRPGLGASDPDPDRDTARGGADVRAVLDALGIDDPLGAVGWSLGGQYALAAAHADARLPAVAVLAGVPPLDRPGVRSALSTTDRLLLQAVSDRVPARASLAMFRLTGRLAARDARRRGTASQGPPAGRRDLTTWGPSDAEVLAGPAGPIVLQAVAEATADPRAAREEYRAWLRPWGFDPAEVAVPVTVHHGDADRWVTGALVDDLVAALPAATVRSWPGTGHLLGATIWPDVLAGLTEAPVDRS